MIRYWTAYLLGWSCIAWGALPILEFKPNVASVQVGDRVHWMVQNSEAIQGHVEFVEERRDWALLPQGAEDSGFIAVPLKPGKLELPSMVLKNASGQSIAQIQGSGVVEVLTAISPQDPQPTQPADLEPPVGLKFPLGRMIGWFILGSGILSALVFLGYRLWKKRKKRDKVVVAEVLSEEEVAWRALKVLEQQGWVQGSYKDYYFRLSEILKNYLGARFQFDAVESTTREILGFLTNQRQLERNVLKELEFSFEQLDLVKFTDHVPIFEDSLRLLQRVRQIVTVTRRHQEEVNASAVQS